MAERHALRLTLLPILLTALLLAPSAVTRSQPGAADRAAYDNDEIFNQMSGAARTRLERIFGPKQPAALMDAKGNILPPQTGAVRPPAFETFASLANSLVNDAAADATAQDTQSETAIVLGAGNVVIAGFNDSGSYIGGASKFTGTSRSTNSGTAWTDQGTLPTNADGDAGDPVLARSSATGTIFLSTLSFNTGYKLLIFRSVDNGITWSAPVNGAPGYNTTTGSQDKQWIAVDNFPGTGNGNVYMFWRNFGSGGGMTFTRSLDDGLTWSPSPGSVLASGTGQGAYVTVGTDHAVYCFWYNSSGTRSIVLRKSADFGLTFGPQTTVTTLTSTGVNGDLGLGAFRSSSFPHAAVNPVSGHLYVVYNDPAAVSGGDRGNIFLRVSIDGGATWAPAIRVNDDAGTNAQFMPTLAVTPDGTGLSVTWYDRRRDPADALIERWGANATITGGTVAFGPNYRISPPFGVVVGVDPVINATYMGDYDMMTADNSFYYGTWGDNRDQSIAVPGRKNANVRHARVPKAGPGAVVDMNSYAITGGNGNGRIDFFECNDFRVTLANNGSATATGVSATLTTSTPNVVILQSPQTFANLAPGATAVNATPFKISTLAGFACGTPVALTLTVTSSGGTEVTAFSLPTGGSDYSVTTSTAAVIDTAGAVDIGNHGDDVSTPVTLPFPYTFYGTSYSAVNASSNGTLQFLAATTPYDNICLPAGTLNEAIVPHWDDQMTSLTYPGKGIYTKTTGVAPNRVFSIEWRTVYYTPSTQSANYQVRLFEGQQKFEIVYGQVEQLGSSATSGVQKGTGANATQYSCNAATLAAGLKVTYQIQACVSGGGDCATLPITLGAMSATPLRPGVVRVAWTTLTEVNNYGFEVQRREGNDAEFLSLPGGFMPGAGTTTEPRHYTWTDNAAPSGEILWYRLKQIDLDGTIHYTEPVLASSPTGVEEGGTPAAFALGQNFPNPFNPSTTIRYAVPAPAQVTIRVYDLLGREVATLVNGALQPGFHSVDWNASAAASGVYFYRMEGTPLAGQGAKFTEMRRLTLVK